MFSLRGFIKFRLKRHFPLVFGFLSHWVRRFRDYRLSRQLAVDPNYLEKQAINRRRLAHIERFRKFPTYPQDEINTHLKRLFPGFACQSGDIVLDFGANEGWFSYVMGISGATVVGFEPNFDSFVKATERTKQLHNVTIVNAAVGPITDLTPLYFPPSYHLAPEIFSGSVSTVAENSNIREGSQVAVFQLGVGEILSAFDSIHFLKIDIEGGEEDLWEQLSANAGKIKYLAIETHESLMSLESGFVLRAREFIERNNLGKQWTLEWP